MPFASAFSGDPWDSLIDKAVRWVVSQQSEHGLDARTLQPDIRLRLTGFFDPATFERARIKPVQAIHPPDFLADMEGLPSADALHLDMASGITFDDVILVVQSELQAGAVPLPLLFHELVHVAQYQILGVPRFVRRYIRDWAQSGFDYFGISLEREAYRLQGRYESEPDSAFSVEDEIRRGEIDRPRK